MATESTRCDRARSWTSLRLDGELSQLESALLTAHLRGCGSCRAFADEVEASTELLRAMPVLSLTEPVLVRARPRRDRRGVHGVAMGAAVLAASLAATLVGLDQLSRSPSGPKPTAMVAQASDSDNIFRSLRRQQLIAQSRPMPRNKAIF